MKSNIVKQALYEMRRQPVAASVTLIGTAFAIFLLMTVMMINSSTTLPMAPESNRSHLLYGIHMHTQSLEDNDFNSGSSSSLSLPIARRLYGGLEGIDTLTYFRDMIEYDRVDVKQPGRPMKVLYRKCTDEGFWSVFDHTFIAGRPYDRAAVDAHADVAVLTESAARALTGTEPEDAIGQTINVAQTPVTIIGVVADHTPLARHAFGEIFMPLRDGYLWGMSEPMFGDISVAMILKDGYSEEDIRRQVKDRYDDYNRELEAEGIRAVYHEQPYNVKMREQPMGSNTTPSSEEADRKNLILILILMIVPAINMSAMSQSRLSRRMAETGIKRAYGATRGRIVAEILAENFVVTLIGGAIGLLFSIAAAWLMSNTIFNGSIDAVAEIRLPWHLLFNWRLFAIALGGCFILNILSAGIPAWRASRINPVDALRA